MLPWILVLGAVLAAGWGVSPAHAQALTGPETGTRDEHGGSALDTAALDTVWPTGQKEWGILAGFSTGTVLRLVRDHMNAFHLRLRWAVHSGAWAPGFLRGNAAIVFEILPLLAVDQRKTAYATGFGVYFRHTVQGRKIRPYVFGGSGVLGATADIPDGEYPFNFESQGGIGIQYRLSARRAVAIEYRFDHISNAGIGPDNPGINSHVALVGFSWY